MRARGVDVSSVQGGIDFPRLAAGGFDYVIPKMTQGALAPDKMFVRDVDGARAAGLLVPMGYHFQTQESAIADQAKNAIAAARSMGLRAVAIDLEYPPPPWAPGKGEEILDRAAELAELMADAGLKLVLYTYPDFWTHITALVAASPAAAAALAKLVALAVLWVAHYPHEQREPTDAEQARILAPWTSWAFWQWSGDHGLAASGIPMVVDHDLFNGTRAELEAWMQPPPPVETQQGADPDAEVGRAAGFNGEEEAR